MFWFCVFGLCFVFVVLFLVCWCVCFCSGLVSLLHDLSHPHSLHTKDFFLLDAAWIKSRAERPSVSYTKVTAKSQGQAISCNYTNHIFKQISGSNKFLIVGDGKDETDARAVRPNSLASTRTMK